MSTRQGPLFSPFVERAIEIAAEWHDGTYRKARWREPFIEGPEDEPARIPVIAHLTAVALTVQRAGWDDETVAAAFLHDVLEDRNAFGDHMREESLRTLVGDAVLQRVLGVTEPKFDADGLPMPWRRRKEVYLERLASATAESVAISLADKQHNLWTMSQGIEAGVDIFSSATGRRALSAGPVDQAWFYGTVLEISRGFADERLQPMREELAVELERFSERLGLRP